HSGIDCIKNKLDDGNETIQLKTMDFIESFKDEDHQEKLVSAGVLSNVGLTSVCRAKKTRKERKIENGRMIQVRAYRQKRTAEEEQEEMMEWTCPQCHAIVGLDRIHCTLCGDRRPEQPLILFPSEEEINTALVRSSAVSVMKKESPVEEEKEEEEETAEPVPVAVFIHSLTLRIRAIHLLMAFHPKYQAKMIEEGLFRYIVHHLQGETLFESHHDEMVEGGIMEKLIENITPNNIKVILLVLRNIRGKKTIERRLMREGYQVQMMKRDCVEMLLELQILDTTVTFEINRFIIGFDQTYWREIAQRLKTLTEEVDIQRHTGLTKSGQHYSIRQQANKIVYQLENHGMRVMRYKMTSNDGGEYSRKLRAKNAMRHDFSVYSSLKNERVHISFAYTESHAHPIITHVIMKNPGSTFESPLKTAVVFVSERPISLELVRVYDMYTRDQFADILDKEINGMTAVCHVDMSGDYSFSSSYKELSLTRAYIAPYITISEFPLCRQLKISALLSSVKKNFEVEYIGFLGTEIESEEMNHMSQIIPCEITDVGNHLGVKKRTKKFDHCYDFDKNGLLYWIGTCEGEKPYVNPELLRQVRLSTSHNMYSTDMKIEEIIGRSRGYSCYWGGSAPQYFVLDLKHRRFRCSHFSLRHGYQAANSFIQDWELLGSLDGMNWTVLFKGFKAPFVRAFESKSWPVLDSHDYFKYFKIMQRGNYYMGLQSESTGSPFLCISGFELYGDLLMD
ncbi:hypothetical protein PROFUN_15708, partial [Planoprotostelium fungivorum]